MTYTLAKKLKDSGYPQDGPPRKFLWQPTDKPQVMANGVYCPTLDELIEACGDKFHNLTRIGRNMWQACVDKECFVSGEGSSRTVAVAMLWLALNPKI